MSNIESAFDIPILIPIMLVLCYHDSYVIVGFVQRILRVVVSGMPLCHIMCMLIIYCHGEVCDRSQWYTSNARGRHGTS